MEKAHRGRLTTTQELWDSQGLGRDHKLLHPTMCASFLATKGGSSISDAEAAGITSSGGRKPLLSIRLKDRTEDYITKRCNTYCN